MVEIISMELNRKVMSSSVVLIAIGGQIPRLFRIRMKMTDGIMIPVNGMAIRLVRRKYLGSVPKYMYAIGPVVIWQDIDIANEFHNFLTFLSAVLSLFISPGQNDLSQGSMNAIPAMAA